MIRVTVSRCFFNVKIFMFLHAHRPKYAHKYINSARLFDNWEASNVRKEFALFTPKIYAIFICGPDLLQISFSLKIYLLCFIQKKMDYVLHVYS
jgi:hypothetical protein